MYIVYQIRTHEHKTVACPEITCPLCKQQGGIHIDIRQRYVWWFGPMCPSAKFGIASCDNCDQRIPNVKWTKEIEQAYKKAKSTLKTPLRMWRGMLVIAGLFVVLVGVAAIKAETHAVDEKALKEYFENPQPNDVYYAHTGGEMKKINENSATSVNQVYALFKVVKVSGDSVFVVQGNARRVSTENNFINEYTSGFWNDIEKETTAYAVTPLIISHKSMTQYRYFSPIPREENSSPGGITTIKRPGK